jgi:hypothetical protein
MGTPGVNAPAASEWASLAAAAAANREVLVDQLQLAATGAARHPQLASPDGSSTGGGDLADEDSAALVA